jgi:hypothetical protein
MHPVVGETVKPGVSNRRLFAGVRSAERALARRAPSIPQESLRFLSVFWRRRPVPLNGLFTMLPMKAVRLVARDEPLASNPGADL